MHFRPSLRRAPHYTCERGSRTLACRHGGCAASHGPPPAGFLRHLTAQSSFFAKTCQHFSNTFPKALPQTSAGCSVLGIIRGYKLRTCPSDRAIGAQPKGATSCVFLFGLLFEVFFSADCSRTVRRRVQAHGSQRVGSTHLEDRSGPVGAKRAETSMQAAPGLAESPETASERPVYRVECPQLRLCRIAQMSESPNVRNRPTCQKLPTPSSS